MSTHSESTRSKILSTAQQLFSKYGYDATGVAEICNHAGVSKGAFYYHFQSKQALFQAILDNWLEDLDASFQNSQQNVTEIPEAILDMAYTAGRLFQSADVRIPMFLEFWTRAFRDPEIWKATIAPFHRYQAYFTQMIEGGIRQGTLKDINPERGARVLISLAIGLLMQSFFIPDQINWAEETQQSIQLIFNGFSRRVE